MFKYISFSNHSRCFAWFRPIWRVQNVKGYLSMVRFFVPRLENAYCLLVMLSIHRFCSKECQMRRHDVDSQCTPRRPRPLV
jgi:hypothetical protein